MIMLHGVKIIIGLMISLRIYSQSFVYSKNYFRWPLAIKPAIVANFGELRSEHWHMGLDMRTNQRENLPVFAAADGYISRASVKAFGYGKAIYINHPNALTTVYGHLNGFLPQLATYFTAQQYSQQAWDIDLHFAKERFPIRKGQLIGYSGSTGASQGPHLHFEIRDTRTERCINPLLFNLPLPDAVAPVFTKLAVYDRGQSVYSQKPVLLPIKKSAGVYIPAKDSIVKTGYSRIGFAIGAYDCVTGSTNQNGIYRARIFLDSQPLIAFQLDSMDYMETRFVNAHIDYAYRYNSGIYLQNLFKLPGDRGRAYRIISNDGTIELNDANVHSVKIEIADAQSNTTTLNFKVQFDGTLSSMLNHSTNGFSPEQANTFKQDDFEVYLEENSLYDSIQPVFKRTSNALPGAVSLLFQFSNASIPVHNAIKVRLKPNVAVEPDWKDKVVIKRTDRKTSDFRKATWEQDPRGNGWLAATFGDFGSYQAFIDNIAPTINDPNGKRLGDTIDLSGSKRIVFNPRDNTGISNFRAELDGKWLMFSNDKGASWIYNFDDRWTYGVHELKVMVGDEVGNLTERRWLIKRYPYTPAKKKPAYKKINGTRKPPGGKTVKPSKKKK